MRRILVLAPVLLLLAGCSHRYAIYSLESEEYLAFSRMAQYGHGTLFLRDGRQLYVHGLELGVDTTSYQTRRARDVTRVPTCEVDSIIFTQRVVGAMGGFAIGAVCGATMGALVGLVIGHDSPSDCNGRDWCLTKADVVGILALLCAPVGAVLGTVTGAGVGDKLIYYPFPEEPGGARPDSVGLLTGAGERLSNKPLQQTAPQDPAPSGGE